MTFKEFGKKLLFPPRPIMIVLIPVAMALLIFSMAVLGTESPISYASYVLSAYTLTVWCFKIPDIIAFIKRFRNENKYMQIWLRDEHLRVNVSLYGSLIFNTVYAVFQLGLGFYHSTFWFYSLGGYYVSLAVMRFFLLRHTRRHKGGEDVFVELTKYRACGWVFLVMNLAFTVIVFFMVYRNRTFDHHEITTIAMAAYTFTAFTLAIINIVKYRKYKSPVYTASKMISLTAASVSILTLESTMLTTFGKETVDLGTRRIMLGASGAAISFFIIGMALYMIVGGTKQLRIIKEEVTVDEQ